MRLDSPLDLPGEQVQKSLQLKETASLQSCEKYIGVFLDKNMCFAGKALAGE